MTTRYRFDLPNDDWFIGEAPEGYAFIVARHGEYPAFRPNIGATTISVAAGTSLHSVMEDSALSTAANSDNLSVGEVAVNDGGTVGRQSLSFSVPTPAGVLELTQDQVFYLVSDDNGADSVLCVVLSVESREAGRVWDDFDAFLDTLRFDETEEK